MDAPSAEPMSRRRLDGASLDPVALLLVACGSVGGLVFTAVYLVEGATRPGYDAGTQAISAISLGPGGWVQQVNFILFGVLTLCSALGWRRALALGTGATAYPTLRILVGVGLIVDGFFSQNPAAGYPPGAIVGATTLGGGIHVIFSFVTITALALTDFVLARRFSNERGWRGWAAVSVSTGLLTIAFIAVFGAMSGHSPGGLFERLAGGVNTLLLLGVLARLLLQARAGSTPPKRAG